jgi:hypothetical protein
MYKRVWLLVLLIAGLLLAFASCTPPESHALEGTWSITTSVSSGTNFGSGSASLSYSYTQGGVDLYEGNGTIGGTSYYVVMGQ